MARYIQGVYKDLNGRKGLVSLSSPMNNIGLDHAIKRISAGLFPI